MYLKVKTDKVTNMHGMFDGCNKLISLDLSNFNTDNATTMMRKNKKIAKICCYFFYILIQYERKK